MLNLAGYRIVQLLQSSKQLGPSMAGSTEGKRVPLGARTTVVVVAVGPGEGGFDEVGVSSSVDFERMVWTEELRKDFIVSG